MHLRVRVRGTPLSACGCAGKWRELEVAIKTTLLRTTPADRETLTSQLAREAATSSILVHDNIVATYSHDMCSVAAGVQDELVVYKFYLIQVRIPQQFCHRACRCGSASATAAVTRRSSATVVACARRSSGATSHHAR